MHLSNHLLTWIATFHLARASLNCTVHDASIPQYACPNSTCPQIGEFKVGDIAWIWCAVDDFERPNRWMFLENNNYSPAGPGVFERYQECWFFEQSWPEGTERLPYCRNATFVPKPPPGPCLVVDLTVEDLIEAAA